MAAFEIGLLRAQRPKLGREAEAKTYTKPYTVFSCANKYVMLSV